MLKYYIAAFSVEDVGHRMCSVAIGGQEEIAVTPLMSERAVLKIQINTIPPQTGRLQRAFWERPLTIATARKMTNIFFTRVFFR